MASSACIASLPAELIAFVIDNLDSLKDLSSLARTNRRLYSAVNPGLYERAASQEDPWPLAWAAHCGVVGTLRKALAAGIDPNHLFIDNMPFDDWKRTNTTTRQALATADNNTVWESDNECESTVDWSPETEDSDHAGTVNTTQPSSNANSDQWGLVFNESDRDSDISMDEFLTHHSDAASSTLDENGPEPDFDDAFDDPVAAAARPRIIFRRFTAIHLAAQAGHNDIINILVDSGANLHNTAIHLCECVPIYGLLNATESPEPNPLHQTWSTLHIAICHGRSETAQLLLSRGASPVMNTARDSMDSPCPTALHHAAAMGLVDVVQYLVDNGIQTDIDICDHKTLTPFYHAYAARRWDSTVPLLLQLGANVDVDTKLYLPYSTITPLGEACRMGHFDDADRLIDLGADVMRGFIHSGRGLSPLHMCSMHSACSAQAAAMRPRLYEEDEMGIGRMKTIAKLIAAGAVLDAKDCSGDTPLIAAAQNRNVPALKALLNAGGNVHEHNAVGRNAVMQAVLGPSRPVATVQQENIEPLAQTLRVLTDGGARLGERDSEGNTVLHLVFMGATKKKLQKSALRVLLSMSGVSELSTIRNRDYQTPLLLAFQTRNLEACEVLVRRGCTRGALQPADILTMFADALICPSEDEATLNFVLDLDVKGLLTSDPLVFEVLLAKNRYSAVRAARFIAQRGLPPLAPTASACLLCQAIMMGEYTLAYSLIENGVDVNACNDEGEVPLAVFVKNHHFLRDIPYRLPNMYQFLQALLDRGANTHLPISPGSSERILNRVIDLDMEDVLPLMLQKQQPLSSDPRAAHGFYLHGAVTISPGRQPCSEKIIDTLLSAGPDLSEVNEEGDTPLSVLLSCLCKERRFTWRYHRFIKALAGPDVDINRLNNEGKSIADYLEQLMYPREGGPGQTTFLTRRIHIIDVEGGRKALRFLPRPQKKAKPSNILLGPKFLQSR
ncbi:ankyrin repeat-containing domain protein [Lasiosphaeris hirsuta]|uniref:Ankyrin repeat-containing domain protein n=1 Tax=Lasiosphaeris hirsuta TaxID=260670 RepID=A0AA40DWT4_9PEZI|nr:ankyrin repeat-containing domain protein [Lasiosphaeris hirsuta]